MCFLSQCDVSKLITVTFQIAFLQGNVELPSLFTLLMSYALYANNIIIERKHDYTSH